MTLAERLACPLAQFSCRSQMGLGWLQYPISEPPPKTRRHIFCVHLEVTSISSTLGGRGRVFG